MTSLPKPSKKLRVSKKTHKKYASSTKRNYWKESERQAGDFLLEHDDPDPKFAPALSKRGRVGHICGLEMDVVSLNWVGENKQLEKLPKWLTKYILKIMQRGKDFNKFPLLRLDVTQEIKIKDLKGIFNPKNRSIEQLSEVEQRLIRNDMRINRLPDLVVIPMEVLGYLLDRVRYNGEEKE